MPAKRYLVDLTQGEREQLLDISRRGKSSARKVKRSLILCKADEGLTDQQVAEAVMVGPSTVMRVRQRFVEGGLERALNDRPRPGKRRKLDGDKRAKGRGESSSLALGPGHRPHLDLGSHEGQVSHRSRHKELEQGLCAAKVPRLAHSKLDQSRQPVFHHLAPLSVLSEGFAML